MPAIGFATVALLNSGFSVLKVVAIALPILIVLLIVQMLSPIVAAPGPRTKATAERPKNRLRRQNGGRA